MIVRRSKVKSHCFNGYICQVDKVRQSDIKYIYFWEPSVPINLLEKKMFLLFVGSYCQSLDCLSAEVWHYFEDGISIVNTWSQRMLDLGMVVNKNMLYSKYFAQYFWKYFFIQTTMCFVLWKTLKGDGDGVKVNRQTDWNIK